MTMTLNKTRINALLGLTALATIALMTLMFAQLGASSGLANLILTFPGLPAWSIHAIRVALETAGWVAAVTAILGSAGLGTVAAIFISQVRKYGTRYAIQW
ncbi:hypothetical protein SAMN04488168_13220 [Bacillus sp. 491mf]|uniref:hypothetical protein n=1 Tax=unclassified Bacillus (in: firmicutes) TaxID=185979 RepID=UPI00068DC8F5|nr:MULTISPECIES: hypothetical protein [unclassified Bacillus (in: firmicutes)]SFD32250.1 hypothetical protein SAMN04488168_13220 [Bacillus sp. 491mf]